MSECPFGPTREIELALLISGHDRCIFMSKSRHTLSINHIGVREKFETVVVLSSEMAGIIWALEKP